jgi:hypothetical protein
MNGEMFSMDFWYFVVLFFEEKIVINWMKLQFQKTFRATFLLGFKKSRIIFKNYQKVLRGLSSWPAF